MHPLVNQWDFSDAFVTFNSAAFFWDGSFSLDLAIGHGENALDLYDNGNGSIQVTWPPFPLASLPDSYNVYLNGVLNQNVATRRATITGLAGASYNGATITPASTYTVYVTAVKGGVETAVLGTSRITVGPTSVMLTTPMKRIFPFPQTGLG